MSRSIYVVSSTPGPIKIGIAKMPRRRFGALQTSSAVPLSLAFVAECDAAEKIERRAHQMLSSSRTRGEWFSVTAAAAIDAVMAAAAELGYEIRPQSVARKARRAGSSPTIGVRVHDKLTSRIDEWRSRQRPIPSRPEAIRLLVDQALKGRK